MSSFRLNSLILWVVLVLEFVQDLDGLEIDLGTSSTSWTVKNTEFKIPATVPGGIYTDLQNAGILTSDLYYRFNEDNFKWVALTNWTYMTTFNLSKNHDIFSKGSIYLNCEGLDTIAEIRMNNEVIGRADNMFRRYLFLLEEDILKMDDDNILEIEFRSPIEYANQSFEEQSKEYIVPPDCFLPQGDCHANHIRKMQSSFGWDWGPSFPSMGIWRKISIIAINEPKMKYVKWSPKLNANNEEWDIKIETIFDMPKTGDTFTGLLHVELLSKDGSETLINENLNVIVERINTSTNGKVENSFKLSQSAVETWWPNEYGKQSMYLLNVEFTGSTEISTKLTQVAFRTLQLVEEPLIKGRTFKFRVNGVDIFAKGSNWIPAHILPEQVTSEYIYDLLYSAKEAHMNMIRVWGGGIYEQDTFYTIADELGIMIWQDFMFACSMYQANDVIRASVEEEVRHQVRRLQSHPSVVLWAGNNENEAALVQNWYGTNSNFKLYKDDYLKLYRETIQKVVSQEDPSRPFVLSSPSNGVIQTENVGGVNANPGDMLFGDVHVYNYYVDGWDPSSYPQGPRFASEYGWQSFPSFQILKHYSMATDWSLASKFAQKRQRHPLGNLELPLQIMQHLKCPDMFELSTPEGFQEFLYLSQITQAEELRTETEVYRRAKSRLDNETGYGMTMGALYWQLNDIWPGASWTSLEHGGNWRMSHYFAQEMFAQVLVSPTLPPPYDQLKVAIVSDTVEKMELELHVKIQRFDSLTKNYHKIQPILIDPLEVVETEFLMEEFLINGNCLEMPSNMTNFNLCFITLWLQDAITNDILSQNKIMPYPKSATGLSIPNLVVSTVVNSCEEDGSRRMNCIFDGTPFSGAFDISLQTDAVALYVWLEAMDIPGHFDRNGFLMDTPKIQLKFFAKSNVTAEALKDALTVRSYTNSLLLP